MSFGKMNGFAELIATKNVKDSEGFSTTVDEVLASIRVYREGRHGGQRWANLAAFSEATDLFRFRCIPGVEIKTDQILISDGDRFEIISVEDVKGRGMYTEVLAKKVVATVQSFLTVSGAWLRWVFSSQESKSIWSYRALRSHAVLKNPSAPWRNTRTLLSPLLRSAQTASSSRPACPPSQGLAMAVPTKKALSSLRALAAAFHSIPKSFRTTAKRRPSLGLAAGPYQGRIQQPFMR